MNIPFLPARAAAKPTRVICDLDKIVSESVCFVFGGEEHFIDPISNETFLKFFVGLQEFYEMKDQGANLGKVDEKLLSLFQSVCKTIKAKHLSKMSMSQKLALFATIVDVVKGNPEAGRVSEIEKKK